MFKLAGNDIYWTSKFSVIFSLYISISWFGVYNKNLKPSTPKQKNN